MGGCDARRLRRWWWWAAAEARAPPDGHLPERDRSREEQQPARGVVEQAQRPQPHRQTNRLERRRACMQRHATRVGVGGEQQQQLGAAAARHVHVGVRRSATATATPAALWHGHEAGLPAAACTQRHAQSHAAQRRRQLVRLALAPAAAAITGLEVQCDRHVRSLLRALLRSLLGCSAAAVARADTHLPQQPRRQRRLCAAPRPPPHARQLERGHRRRRRRGGGGGGECVRHRMHDGPRRTRLAPPLRIAAVVGRRAAAAALDAHDQPPHSVAALAAHAQPWHLRRPKPQQLQRRVGTGRRHERHQSREGMNHQSREAARAAAAALAAALALAAHGRLQLCAAPRRANVDVADGLGLVTAAVTATAATAIDDGAPSPLHRTRRRRRCRGPARAGARAKPPHAAASVLVA